MKLSAILEPLIAAGVPGEVILATVRAFESQQTDALERRRESDRKRQTDKRSRDITLRHSDRLLVTRAEDSSSTQEIKENKEVKKDTSPPARSTRGTRLPDDFRPDIEAAVAEGLSRQEAERQALSFCDYWRSKPGAAALKLDWPATWRMWFRRRLDERPQSSPKRQTGVSGAAQRIIESEGNGSESIFGSHSDAQRLPAASGGGPRNAAPDLSSGIGRQFVTINH